jgi:hypothetical protein
MPAPSELHKELETQIVKIVMAHVAPLLDKAWEAGQRATLASVYQAVTGGLSGTLLGATNPEPVRQSTPPDQGKIQFPDGSPLYDHPRSIEGMSPQKRGAQNREKKGVVKNTISAIIHNSPQGVSRAQIREMAQNAFGLSIKDGSLKQGLRLLSKAGEIENRDQRWFPKRNDGQHG